MSFVVEAMGRRDSAFFAHAASPEETSMTIALGAVTAAGHAGAAWLVAGSAASAPAAAAAAASARRVT
jgi:hypothetical protein